MSSLKSLLETIQRLNAALHLVRLAEEVIPALVSAGKTTASNAAQVLEQIPRLRDDIDEQVRNVQIAMQSVHDRVETLAQFLLLHRNALTPGQMVQLNRHLKTIREGVAELTDPTPTDAVA